MMSPRKQSQLRIDVLDDEILLHGQAEESAGKLLQGTLVLDISEPMKVRSVILKFTGKMKVSWSEGKSFFLFYFTVMSTIIKLSEQ